MFDDNVNPHLVGAASSDDADNAWAVMRERGVICDDWALIPLKSGQFMTCDLEDFATLSTVNYSATQKRPDENLYAYGWDSVQKRGVYAHRVVMGEPKGWIVDHASFDTLDQRKVNLRLSTPSQNAAHQRKKFGVHSSDFLGVSWYKTTARWRASIRTQDGIKHLGYFLDEEAAARAYDEAAREIHSEFASLNFPEES